MSALGDILYRASLVWSRLAGNTTTTKKFFTQTGDGVNSAAPAWGQVNDSDVQFTDIATGNVSSTKHGFAPKGDGSSGSFLGGDGAYHPLTGGGGLGGNVTSVVAFGSEPASPNTGDIVIYNNAPFCARYSGSAWVPFGPAWYYTKPDDSQFSWLNQSTSTLDTTHGSLYISSPNGAGTNWRSRYKAMGTNTRIEIGVIVHLIQDAQAGLVLYESATGKIATLSVIANAAQLAIQHWTNSTTFGGNDLTGVVHFPSRNMVWLGAQIVGANITYIVSTDGFNWTSLSTFAKTTQFTTGPDKWGFTSLQSSNYTTGIGLVSIKES